MNHPAQATAATEKRMNYGQCQAIKVLAAHRMNLAPACVADATAMMQGASVHPIVFASVSREACRIHNALALDETSVRAANGHVATLMAEYGFA